MPNDRDAEMRRFDGERDALAERMRSRDWEQAISEQHRPFDRAANRQALIRNWWPLERKSA